MILVNIIIWLDNEINYNEGECSAICTNNCNVLVVLIVLLFCTTMTTTQLMVGHNCNWCKYENEYKYYKHTLYTLLYIMKCIWKWYIKCHDKLRSFIMIFTCKYNQTHQLGWNYYDYNYSKWTLIKWHNVIQFIFNKK